MYRPHEIAQSLASAFAVIAVILALAAAWFLRVRSPASSGNGAVVPHARWAGTGEVPGAYPAPPWEPGYRNYFAPVRTASRRANRRPR